MKKVLLILLLLGGIAAAIGFYFYNKGVPSLANKKADVEVNATQLLAEYEQDETTANEKYLGKIVAVTGTVAAVNPDETPAKVLLFADSPMAMVICEMEHDHEGLESLAGEQVTIKGECSGYLSDVILVRATLVE